MLWSYGVITVPFRRDTHFANTIESLKKGGFDSPRIFIDGARIAYSELEWMGLECTTRYPNLQVSKNWLLSMWELYLRCPNADMYAMFQDDIKCYTNLRSYLERCGYPTKGYLNLYTCPSNQESIESKPDGNRIGWHESRWTSSGVQSGKGALGLVFSNDALTTLLTSSHMVKRFRNERISWKNLDGAVVQSMNEAGWREMVHYPSLLQHTAPLDSVIIKGPRTMSNCYRGDNFNAVSLLQCRCPNDLLGVTDAPP